MAHVIKIWNKLERVETTLAAHIINIFAIRTTYYFWGVTGVRY